MYYLLTACIDYADEFDCEEFCLMDTEEYQHFVQQCNSHEKPIRAYFGTNEALEFLDGEDLLNQVDVKIITEDEYNTLIKLFGAKYFGTGSAFSALD